MCTCVGTGKQDFNNVNFIIFYILGKAWPLLVGSGFGVGLAYGNCEKEISQALSVSASKKT